MGARHHRVIRNDSDVFKARLEALLFPALIGISTQGMNISEGLDADIQRMKDGLLAKVIISCLVQTVLQPLAEE